MRPAVLITVIVAVALTALAIIWVAPVVGVRDSACQQHPYTSGCR